MIKIVDDREVFVFSVLGDNWINIKGCTSIKVVERKHLVDLLAIYHKTYNHVVESTIDKDSLYGIVLNFSGSRDVVFITGFKEKDAATSYVNEMLDNAKVLGVPDGQ